ncbi:9246_t:CDS:2, partial [Racocetra fulgida]
QVLAINSYNKSVTVEDDSSSTNSNVELMHKNDVETVQKAGQTNFEANFGRILVDMLKFLCYELSVSELGSKQDLRYVLLDSDISVKEKVVDVDNVAKEVFKKGSRLGFELKKVFVDVFNNASSSSAEKGLCGESG